jgi:hypothetical protein
VQNLYITLLFLACTTTAWAQWGASAPWVRHTLPSDPAYVPLKVSFELPDYMARSASSEIPQWKHFTGDLDYFQVLFGGHDPKIVRASDPDMTDEEANQVLRERTLKQIAEKPETYRLLDAAFQIRSADGARVPAILYQEVDSSEDVALQRKVLSEALASLPPAEREVEIRKNLDALSQDVTFHLAGFARGKKLLVTVHFTKTNAEAKKEILNRFLASLIVG